MRVDGMADVDQCRSELLTSLLSMALPNKLFDELGLPRLVT